LREEDYDEGDRGILKTLLLSLYKGRDRKI
jgi:hypothetical protein